MAKNKVNLKTLLKTMEFLKLEVGDEPNVKDLKQEILEHFIKSQLPIAFECPGCGNEIPDVNRCPWCGVVFEEDPPKEVETKEVETKEVETKEVETKEVETKEVEKPEPKKEGKKKSKSKKEGRKESGKGFQASCDRCKEIKSAEEKLIECGKEVLCPQCAEKWDAEQKEAQKKEAEKKKKEVEKKKAKEEEREKTGSRKEEIRGTKYDFKDLVKLIEPLAEKAGLSKFERKNYVSFFLSFEVGWSPRVMTVQKKIRHYSIGVCVTDFKPPMSVCYEKFSPAKAKKDNRGAIKGIYRSRVLKEMMKAVKHIIQLAKDGCVMYREERGSSWKKLNRKGSKK